MAGVAAHPEPRLEMPNLPRSVGQPPRAHRQDRRRELARGLAIVVAVIALLLTSSALNWVTQAAAAADAPKKAVIVSGPVHSLTSKYKGYAKAIADAAEARGMDVKRVFHPNAPASRVKRLANGADLFVYVGHGNGWPSSFGPFQEDTKNGLGLDPEDPKKRSPSTVVYKGANWLRENITLAPNAVVILSHLSYASGNASSGMPIPTRNVAVQRVDNFANGFLACGAQVVWALGWQPGADIVDALFDEDATMDAIFMTRYRSGVNPLNGWIGQDPATTSPSERRVPASTSTPIPRTATSAGSPETSISAAPSGAMRKPRRRTSRHPSSAVSAPPNQPPRSPRRALTLLSSPPTATASATASSSTIDSPRAPSWR